MRLLYLAHIPYIIWYHQHISGGFYPLRWWFSKFFYWTIEIATWVTIITIPQTNVYLQREYSNYRNYSMPNGEYFAISRRAIGMISSDLPKGFEIIDNRGNLKNHESHRFQKVISTVSDDGLAFCAAVAILFRNYHRTKHVRTPCNNNMKSSSFLLIV